MFTEPKRGNGLNESKICYSTKKLWAITHYNDFYHKITFKHFINNIKHFIEIYQFDWDKSLGYPNYSTACRWYKKYDFKACEECYENYQLGHNQKEAQKLYDKRYFNDTSTDYQRLDETAKNIDELRSQSHPNVYAIAKEEETYDRIAGRIQDRLGRKSERYEVDMKANVKSDLLVRLERQLPELEDETND